MKNSGIEWIGEIPDSWTVVRMKHLYDYSNGSPVRVGPFGSTLPSSDIVQNGVWVYTQKTVLEQNFKTNNTFVSQEKAMELTSFAVTDGDVLITTRGTIGKTAVVPNGSPNGILHPCVIRFRIDEKKMSKELLSLIFNQTDIAFGQIMDMSNSTTIEVLYSYSLKEIWLPCPTLDKQLKILEIVKKLAKRIDECISTISSQIEKLKEYKQSVITEAVTKGLDPTAPMKDSGVEWIGKIPDRWKLEKLKFHSTVNNEKKIGEQIPYIALENIEGFTGKLVTTESIYDVTEAIVAEKGDVLFGKLRPYLAKVYLVQNKSYVSSEFAVFRCNDVSSNFLKWYMLGYGFLDTVNASTCGTKMPRANIDFISNMPIPIISIEEQEKIATHIDTQCAKIDKLIALKQSKIEKLQEYKKSLIYEYVTGKKEVI